MTLLPADEIWESSAEEARRLAARLRQTGAQCVAFERKGGVTALVLEPSLRHRRMRDALAWEVRKLFTLPTVILSGHTGELFALEAAAT